MTTRFLFDPPRAKSKKANLKSLLVRCPSTSRLTDTGQTVEEERWAKTKLREQKFTCAHCGSVHRWTKSDVVLGRPLS